MTQDTQIAIRISERLLIDLDDMRRRETDVPTRAEMIRRLIEREAANFEKDHFAKSCQKFLGIVEAGPA